MREFSHPPPAPAGTQNSDLHNYLVLVALSQESVVDNKYATAVILVFGLTESTLADKPFLLL